MSSEAAVLLCISALIAAYFVNTIVQRRKHDVHRLPGPSTSFASWIWGHEKEVFEHEANESYAGWIPYFGSLYKIKAAFLHPDIIVAADHAAVQHIFNDTNRYVKSPAFRPPIDNLMGKGLVWAEGEDHKRQRRILSPAFTPESVKGMSDDVFESAERLESRLTNHILANKGAATVNIIDFVSPCTLDIIGRVGFGFDFQFGESVEAKEIFASWHNHVNTGLTPAGLIAPITLRAMPFITKLPLEAIQAQGVVKQIVNKLATSLMERGSGRENGKDILSILLRAGEKASAEDRLTPQQIRENLATLAMVGQETVSGQLCFTLMELARNPEIQQKLRDELKSAGNLDHDGLQKLPYLDAVIKEGLRMHPASPQTERVCLTEDVIPLSKPIRGTDGTIMTSIRVQPGQIFHIPFLAMQTNTQVWGKDANEFKPERWITPGAMPPPSELPHGWSSLVTFCDGPRNCIGYRLALFESRAILASLIRSLEFHETSAVIKRKISPTMQPVVDGKGGLLPLHVTLVQA